MLIVCTVLLYSLNRWEPETSFPETKARNAKDIAASHAKSRKISQVSDPSDKGLPSSGLWFMSRVFATSTGLDITFSDQDARWAMQHMKRMSDLRMKVASGECEIDEIV